MEFRLDEGQQELQQTSPGSATTASPSTLSPPGRRSLSTRDALAQSTTYAAAAVLDDPGGDDPRPTAATDSGVVPTMATGKVDQGALQALLRTKGEEVP